MSSKTANIFNTDFVFEDDVNNFEQSRPVKRPPKKPFAVVEEEIDEQEIDDFDGENTEIKKNAAKEKSNKTNEILKKQDVLRIKEASVKKRKNESDDFFEAAPEVKQTNSFDEMNLSKPLMKALQSLGFNSPTEIQQAVVPTALLGKDICACAVTGSGKTLSFMIPTVERLIYKPKYPQVTRVLVLTPTRELAAQICKVTRDITQFTQIQTCLCAGGFDIKSQEAALRLGPDICIATPGRLIDHLHNTPSFNLETVEILILDEADRMLDEYFAEQIKEIMRLCSKTRQTMLFSATMTDNVDDLVNVSLNRPVKIFINQNVDVTPHLKQEFIRIRDNSERHKDAVLAALITRKFQERVIVFVKTKIDCHRLCLMLNLLDIHAAELHGGLSQTQRLEKLNEFKDEKLNVLVATDLASRGLDIANVNTVINYAMPISFKHYIHRVGRTARAGKSGRSISMVTENDRWLVKEIIKSSAIPVKSRVIPTEVIQVYKDKVEELGERIVERLREEKAEKMMEKAESQITKAQKKIKGDKKEEPKIKRTWLQNVEYKYGAKEKREEQRKLKKRKKNENDNGETNHYDDADDDDFNLTGKKGKFAISKRKKTFKK